MHPVLEQQNVMNGGGHASAAPPKEGAMTYDSEWISKGVPNVVAAMAAGSVLTLIILRAAGFRFSFGVNVGGGS